MNTTESLNKAFQLLGELINEDCFDFFTVEDMNFDERKEYLKNQIEEYSHTGEGDLLNGMIRFTWKNDEEMIEKFFNENPKLIADTILLMDYRMYENYRLS